MRYRWEVAISATMHRFSIGLSDVDRGVYEALDLRVAQHPSESERRMLSRVLAYGLRFEEGIEMGRGLSASEDPALSVRDLRGDMTLWIDVGHPQPKRLHRAMKAVGRVVVYTHKEPTTWLRDLQRAEIHDKASLEIWSLPPALLDELEGRVSRNTALGITVSDGVLYVDVDGETFEGTPTRHSISAD